MPGFFQPVEIKAPPGALISLASSGEFEQGQPGPVRVGLLIGQVYRLRVTNIPQQPGLEVYPTIEPIDRLYAPPDQMLRFPIPVELAQDDLELALAGKFVTRVIYLEDPLSALPVRENPRAQNWFEVRPGADPLAVADALGRPVAVLRLGARLPDGAMGPDMAFFYGCPTFIQYPASQAAGAKRVASRVAGAKRSAAPAARLSGASLRSAASHPDLAVGRPDLTEGEQP